MPPDPTPDDAAGHNRDTILIHLNLLCAWLHHVQAEAATLTAAAAGHPEFCDDLQQLNGCLDEARQRMALFQRRLGEPEQPLLFPAPTTPSLESMTSPRPASPQPSTV